MTSFHSNYCITLYITRKIYCTFFAVILVNISTFFFFYDILGKTQALSAWQQLESIFQEINKADQGVFIF